MNFSKPVTCRQDIFIPGILDDSFKGIAESFINPLINPAFTGTTVIMELFFKYYLDVTKYNILVSFLVAFISLTADLSLFSGICCFGTFGTILAFYIYRYYKKIEYYFYLNKGLSKKKLMRVTFIINFIISLALFIIIWIIR